MSKHDPDALETMDSEKVSNLQLAMDTEGTADEVDSSELKLAPSPTAEDLQHSSVDISSSLALDSRPNDDVGSRLHTQDSTTSPASKPTRATNAVEPIPSDLKRLDEVDQEAAGSESPARRTLELPPALDLAQDTESPSAGHMIDVPLASPTDQATDASGTGLPSEPPSPGLGISGSDQQQGSTGASEQTQHAQGPPLPPKQPVFTYTHDDSDTAMAELEEFFSYVEVRGVVEEGREAWARGWESTSETSWLDASITSKKAHIYHLIEELEHRDPEIRFEASRRLAYIAQGTPVYSTSPEHHLQLVVSNCTVLRSAGALTAVHEALKSAGGRWNIISSMPDPDAGAYAPSHTYFPTLSPQERQEYLEEINGELAVHLSVLYFMVEIMRGDSSWADELMALDPPLPIYLFGLVAGLREKNAKGYPVKKLLLLLWKSMLACLGGHKDMKRVKRLVRKIEDLPKDAPDDSSYQMKASPLDYANFKGEIINKYPTYEPPIIPSPIKQIPLDRVVAAAASAPLKQGFQLHSAAQSTSGPGANGQNTAAALGSGPLPATPAPSPPPSPPPMKPKKQQYQTDQSKPFVLPFSRANVGGGHYASIKGKGRMTVPYSIDEASKLYKKNIRVSTELWQTWKLREEYLADETGFGQESDTRQLDPASSSEHAVSGLQRRLKSLTLDDEILSKSSRDAPHDKAAGRQGAHPPDALSMLYQLENKARQELKNHKKSQPPADQGADFNKRSRKLAVRIEDIKRLQRVELIYRSTLASMHSAVIVLLKLLLATVTANTNASVNTSEGDAQPALSLEDTDIMRHREITSKAVSAILILSLRWFKTSHAMKFHYLAHLLVDSNCLLLILKMFGLQEVSTQIQTKNEVTDWNFFQYCSMYGSAQPIPSKPQEQVLRARQETTKLKTASPRLDDEPELITSYSWRNFFAVINFVHILQKLTKRKAHRICLLVQYKSSAILKRILKISQPLLQLYVLKVVKSQIPYCGRKWRQANMKVITAVYLNCQPELRDEWLTTIDIDNDLDESMPPEQTLRTLVHFFNTKHYSSFAPHLHRRSSSYGGRNIISMDGQPIPFGQTNHDAAFGHLQGASGQPLPSPAAAASPHGGSSFFDNEAFPPARPLSAFGGDDHYRTSYIPDSLMDGYLENYEEILGDLFTPTYDANGLPVTSGTPPFHGNSMSGGMSPGRALGESAAAGPAYFANAEHAWHRLGEILGDGDAISDSESVASIGYLDMPSDGEISDVSSDDGPQPGRNDWEHLSPELATALEEDRERQEWEERMERASPGRRKRTSSPHSPRLRRSSSGTPRSPALRAVLVDMDSQDDNEEDSAIDEDEDEGPPLPHMRSPRRSPHLSPSKVAIDEVEAFWPDEAPM